MTSPFGAGARQAVGQTGFWDLPTSHRRSAISRHATIGTTIGPRSMSDKTTNVVVAYVTHRGHRGPDSALRRGNPRGNGLFRGGGQQIVMPQADCIRLIAMVIAAAMAGLGLWLVAARLKAKDQGFGPNSLKALGLVLFLPVLVIASVIVPDFRSETVAALLGTVAGYVLSNSGRDDA